jgi:intein/homing endonuclease
LYANTNTLETAPKTVLETYVRQVEKLVHLTINGEEIVTTDNHPFYVQGRGFINAGNLLVGDKLISVNGEDLFVEKHRVEEFDEPVKIIILILLVNLRFGCIIITKLVLFLNQENRKNTKQQMANL